MMPARIKEQAHFLILELASQQRYDKVFAIN
jgi:hypothetical protein